MFLEDLVLKSIYTNSRKRFFFLHFLVMNKWTK